LLSRQCYTVRACDQQPNTCTLLLSRPVMNVNVNVG
jgi:hypothetical protein